MTADLDDTDFPRGNEAEWCRRAQDAIGGDSLETLASLAEDGFLYGPVHPRFSPAVPIAGNGPPGWKIVQRVDDPNAARANAQALADLEGGADALSLVLDGAPSAYGFGLERSEDAIRTVLGGVMLDIVHLRIEPHPDARLAVESLGRLAAERGHALEDLDVDLGLDPIGPFAFRDSACAGESGLDGETARLAATLVTDGLRGRVLEADGRVYHEAGGSAAEELGAVLASAVHHLRTLEAAGMERVSRAIGFTVSIDQKPFFGIAKIRALRLLWHRVLELCGVERPAAARVHAETSFRMMADKDPHTNILRTTIAGFAAAAGGADSVSVLPYTSRNGLPDAKARRLARNGQLILLGEAGLGHVGDPADGSGGIEALTDGIAAAAWAELQRIEAEGGLVASLRAGALEARIRRTREARRRRVADGTEPAVGVTLYASEREHDVAVLMRRPAEPEPSGDAAGGTLAALRPQAFAGEPETAP